MKYIAILIALVSCQCLSSDWKLPTKIDPQGPAPWNARVGDAASTWNGLLIQACSFQPFTSWTGGQGSLPIILVDPSVWNGCDEWRAASGCEWADRIEIKGAASDLSDTNPMPTAFVLHELGHALGLAHTDEAGSIMNPTVTGLILQPSTKDIARVCGLR